MGNKKIKFAVVGCGHIGKRHASMILGNNDFELVALCDTKPIEVLGLDNFNGARFFNSIDALIHRVLKLMQLLLHRLMDTTKSKHCKFWKIIGMWY
mgnify:CR=1 FL=1